MKGGKPDKYPTLRQHGLDWNSGMPANKRLRGFDASERHQIAAVQAI
jgi:hypothetical protein